MASDTARQCPICKHTVEDDAVMCPLCGCNLLITCVGCGNPSQIKFSYCPYCGRPLGVDEVLPTYQELQNTNDKNRRQLMKYARDVTKLFLEQRRLEKYLPTGLLDKVLLSDSQVVGERRYLTVLFSDVVGFTQLSSALDPEEVFVLMNECFGLLVEQVYKFGGSVDKFIGDALMVLFGAPISYGNDSERAVRSAIAMQTAMNTFNQKMIAKLDKPLELRIGITSGEAIAGTVGVEGQWSYTVMGSTVNMASRLQSAADPGSIFVNEDIYTHTKDLFNYRILRPMFLKGIGDAIPVFEVLGELDDTPRLQQLPLTQLSPFVGRETELAQLTHFLNNLTPAGGGAVFITGDAGLGKTRLMWEWQCQFPPQMQIWAGFAKNLSQSSYEIWRQVILQGLNIRQEARQTVAEILLNYLGDETWLPYLETLLFDESIENEKLASLAPEQLKQQIFAAVSRLLNNAAQRNPLVIFLDDLQWMDQLSTELLQSVLELSASEPIIFCLGSRPQNKNLASLVTASKGLLGECVIEISLEPLSAADSARLLHQKLVIDDMPPELQNYILDRAQNNPYFLEEIITFIINSGCMERQNGKWHIRNLADLTELSLPGTLRGLVRAQLDRLSEADQQVLSYGAIIGPTFSISLLSLVLKQASLITNAPSHLAVLVEQGVITSDGANCHFVHNSVHEIIYHSLLTGRRRQLHEQVAQALETRTGSSAPADIEQLAHHYTAANNALKAVPYLIEAGEKAAQRIAYDRALNYFATALDLLPQAPKHSAREEGIHLAMGNIYQHQDNYDQALISYQQGLELAETANQRADYYRLIGLIRQRKGDIAEEQI